MGTSKPPKTDLPASENPSPIERLSKKDTPQKNRKLRPNSEHPRLCGQCRGTGLVVEEGYGIAYCDMCGGDGIG